MRVAVLSDTHGPRFWKSCPDRVAAVLDTVELILHAGDVCTPDVLHELSSWAPVQAVRGNNDGADIEIWGAHETLELSVGGLQVAMIHDSGPSAGRPTRLHRRFPHADMVIFGHSHIPLNEQHGEQRIFNPGSPIDRRRQPHGTMGLLQIADGRLESADIIEVS
ncbi:MAG: metallophosphoesterase family protein [Jatrophihabitantaceae bacterium]